jgi:Concanavalin A-like lectin/glucanases superfamily
LQSQFGVIKVGKLTRRWVLNVWPEAWLRAEHRYNTNSMKPSNQALTRSFVALACATSVLVSVVSAQAATYSSTVLGDNPVAYYRLEELPGATTAVDSSGNGFDALYLYNLDTNNVPDFPVLGLPGIETNSIQFHVYTDNLAVRHRGVVGIPFHPELSPTTGDGQHGAPFSVECWVKPNTRPSDYSSPLAMFGHYGDPDPFGNASGWNIYQTPLSGGSAFWAFNLKNGALITATAVPIVPVQWYHLVATFNGSTLLFYVNGVMRVSAGGITGYYADNLHDGQIGAGDNTGFLPFEGDVDEVAFYTNVLSSGQIQTHYQAGTNSFSNRAFPPVILQDPVSTTANAGSAAKLEGIVDGAPPVSYIWLRNGSPISGATTNPLSFVTSYPADNGATFNLVAANAFGSVTSAVATLTVVGTLSIDHSPFSITREEGSNSMAAFRVVASGATPISYQWYKVSGGTTNIIAGGTSDTLWLSNLQLSDNGNAYFVRATNVFVVTNSAQATLTVNPRLVNVPLTGYAKIVAADKPTAYWRLDETTGSTVAVDAVGSFDGTYAGGSDLTFSWPTGIPHESDPSVHFTSSARVTVPYALELNPVTGPWSAEFWLEATSQDANFHTPISSIWNSDFGNHLFGWLLYQNPLSHVWTYNPYGGGGGGGFISDNKPTVVNSWYQIVITDDLTTQRFYVNNTEVWNGLRAGLFIPNGINGDPAVAGGPTTFAVRSDGEFGQFDGGIDDVAFYNYALSTQQIGNHFANSVRLAISKVGNNVVLTWPVGTLQAAPLVTGTYTNVTGAISPYTNTVSSSATFYRLQVQ